MDAHAHFTIYAETLLDLDFEGLDGDEILERIARRDVEAPPGGWIRGRRLSPFAFASPLDRHRLDEAASHPLAVWTPDLHSVFMNTAALLALGVPDAPTPPGGEIPRGDDGFPTGLLKERACEIFGRKVPRPGPDEVARALKRAALCYHAQGFVGAASYETPEGLAMLARVPVPDFDLALFRYAQDIAPGEKPGAGPRGLDVRGVKFFLDGSLGSRSAWMKAPFSDYGGHGICRLEATTAAQAETLRREGWLLSFHAIGDGAVGAALDLLDGRPGRIEHIQLVDPFDLDRIGPYVTASLQPSHLATDRLQAPQAFGEARLPHAYPIRSLLERGAVLVFGTDAPVERPDGPLTLRMAVDRRARPEDDRFVPAEAVGPEEALRALTDSPNRTLGIGPGTIRRGGPATFAVFGGDLRTEVGRGRPVLRTVIRGREMPISDETGP